MFSLNEIDKTAEWVFEGNCFISLWQNLCVTVNQKKEKKFYDALKRSCSELPLLYVYKYGM